jgi:hypothetical protein
MLSTSKLVIAPASLALPTAEPIHNRQIVRESQR